MFRILPLLFILVSAVDALAMGPACENLFRDSHKVLATQAYRRQLVERARTLISDLEFEEMKTLEPVDAYLSRRARVTDGSIAVAVRSSPTLLKLATRWQEAREALRAPPEIFSHTISAIEDPTLSDAYLVGILKVDPYFEWLKHNALPFKVPPQHRRTFVQEELGVGDYQPDPAELFMRYRGQGLFPDLALRRVQRNLDPELPDEARTAIDHALILAARVHTIEQTLIPEIASRTGDAGTIEAWYQMTSLEAGRRALRELRARLDQSYRPLFSENAFDRLLLMYRSHKPVADVVEKFRIERILGRSDEDILQRFHREIEALRQAVAVGTDISDVRFMELCQRAQAHQFQGSYWFVLADVFESPVGVTPSDGAPANIVSSQMLVLHKLVGIGEGLDSRRNIRTFVEEMSRENELLFTN